MSLRLDLYGEISKRWWLECLEEDFNKQENLSLLMIGGMDGDICLHVVQAESDSDDLEVALGYPTEDDDAQPFDYPEHIDLAQESELLAVWGEEAGVDVVDEESWERLVDLFIDLHNYELKYVLQQLQTELVQKGYRLSEDFEAGIFHHDDEDNAPLAEAREIVLETLEFWSTETQSALLFGAYKNPIRADLWFDD